MNKIKAHVEEALPVVSSEEATEKVRNSILLCNKQGWFHVKLEHIIYCSTYRSGTVFHLDDKQEIFVDHPLKYFERLLSVQGFVRIHQANLINTDHLLKINKTAENHQALMSNGLILPVGQNKFRRVIKVLMQRSIN